MPTKNRRSLETRGRSTSYITTGGAGYVPTAIDVSKTKQSINKRLYRTISPLEANYSLLPALQSFLSNKEYDDTRDGINEEYPVGTVDAIWAKYLQVPEKDRRYSDRLERSSYRPSKGSNSDDYYKLPLQDYEKESLVNTTRELPLYNNKVSKLLNNYALGEHTVGRGYDKHGEYASYFDVFDINPFNGKYGGINIPVVNKLDDIGIGKPVRIYDRLYLDDYYGVKEPTHATYLPEVVITGNRKKHKDGGFIHIAPSKRGTFTAAATKHGMGVQEFASKVLRNKEDYSPSLVKKANFARNASKWNH